MKLCIMTRGRVGRQETLKWIPNKWKEHTWLVCPHREEHGWEQTLHTSARNYSEKFQWLYDGTLFPEENKVVIMDDDLYFNRYIDGRLCVIKDREEVTSMFDFMEQLLDEFPLVGVHSRMMAQTAKVPYDINGKIVTIQGINRGLAPRGLKLDQHPILADVRLNCEILSRGHSTARITTHFVDWLPSQSAGGCDYRTAEMQREATGSIARDFGPYAQQVIKRPKTAKWLGDERYDLKVRWKDLHHAAPNT
jgi:hypothetical protein